MLRYLAVEIRRMYRDRWLFGPRAQNSRSSSPRGVPSAATASASRTFNPRVGRERMPSEPKSFVFETSVSERLVPSTGT